jgi:hypothetical protein
MQIYLPRDLDRRGLPVDVMLCVWLYAMPARAAGAAASA